MSVIQSLETTLYIVPLYIYGIVGREVGSGGSGGAEADANAGITARSKSAMATDDDVNFLFMYAEKPNQKSLYDIS